MNIYKYEIRELLSRSVEVSAESEDEAYERVKEMYHSEQIVLDSGDHIDTEIKELKS